MPGRFGLHQVQKLAYAHHMDRRIDINVSSMVPYLYHQNGQIPVDPSQGGVRSAVLLNIFINGISKCTRTKPVMFADDTATRTESSKEAIVREPTSKEPFTIPKFKKWKNLIHNQIAYLLKGNPRSNQIISSNPR